MAAVEAAADEVVEYVDKVADAVDAVVDAENLL